MKIKSVIAAIIAFFIFGGNIGNAYCQEETPAFRDIKGSFAEQAIIRLSQQGIIHGINANQYAPRDNISRQQFAILIAKTLGVQPFFPTEPNFSDISPGTVEAGYIEALANLGLIKGTGNNTFDGDSPVQRQEGAVIVQKALEGQTQAPSSTGKSSSTGKYKDEGQISPYAVDSVAYLTDKGWMNGSKGYFYPLRNLTRAEAALLIDHLFETRIEQASNSLQKPEDKLVTQSPLALELETELEVTYKLVEQSPDQGFKNTESKYYPGPVEGLFTKSDTWTGFLRQQGRDIIVDLGSLRTASSISLEFMQNANSGIYLPKYLEGSMSVDGVSWYQLGHAYHGIDPSDINKQNVTLSLSFPPVNARYIKLSFPVEVWVLARNLTVTGGLPAEKPVILTPVERDTRVKGYLQDPEMKNILLVYTGDRSYQQTLSGSDFLPLVAYMNRQGKIKGQMFDTMLFLPYTKMPCTKNAWDSYLEDLFAQGKQLHSLEDTVARINAITGRQNKEKVILTIPYPDSKQSDFDGTHSFSEQNVGKDQAAKNRSEAVVWFYGELMNKWNSAGFRHLDLAGIYWYGESVNRAVYNEEDLVRKVAHLVKDNGQRFFWIPYYGAQGFGEWKSYGFTHVFLQPNYYATPAPPDDRMERAADLARQYGTGIEIEFDNRIISNPYFYELFYKEMKKAHQLGLDRNSVNAYHVGIKGTLLDIVYSDFPEVRKIYDDIYSWISGSYK